MQKTNTSWAPVGKWYNELVSTDGHYFHQHVILPKILKLMELKPGESVLDLACGQGILSSVLPENVTYLGIDSANNLINIAKKNDRRPHHHYLVSDITKPFALPGQLFDFITIILALQNIENYKQVVLNAGMHLKPDGKFIIVLNHPYFRIPKNTSWGIDATNKVQYRRVDRYLTPQKIPVTIHPGQHNSPVTWSFHHPLSDYSRTLNESGMSVSHIEEWVSDKKSQGSVAVMENNARAEIPLFMAIVAKKNI